jgi:hypothetical protein
VIGILIAALTLPPVPAARLAARIFGAPAPELVHITRRESSGRWIGVHPRDASLSALVWRKAVAARWLDPNRCEHHRYAAGQWHTRGAFGLSAAYNLRYLPGCWPPEVLDVPIVSAIVATRKWKRVCERPTFRHGWCS